MALAIIVLYLNLVNAEYEPPNNLYFHGMPLH